MPAPRGAIAGSTSSGFGADHEWLGVLLAGASRAWATGDADLAARLFTKLERRLRRHMRVEDEALYAAVARRAPEDAARLLGLRAEHDDLGRRLDRIATLLDEGDARTGPELDELSARLSDHERREEEILFPACDRLLDPAVTTAAVGELDRRLWGPARY